jgi:hypothetical protein
VGDVLTVADIERFRRTFSRNTPPIDEKFVACMDAECARHIGGNRWAEELKKARRQLASLRFW